MFQVKDIPIHPDYYKYPSSDGELMAETTRHLNWIVNIKDNLETLTEGQNVFVAADLLWYPVEGKSHLCKAPDVMVAFGRPKGDRDSYLQWLEKNVAPQVVFEIFSKSNRRRENKENLLEFYKKYGVEEYYSYDPDRNVFVIYLLQGNDITRLEDMPTWESPLLKIRFEWSEAGFIIYRPDGDPFINFQELGRQYKEEKKLRLRERKRADNEAHRADNEANRADASEKQRLILAAKLRQLGVDPDAL